MAQLILKCASASRPSGEWNADDFDVLADGAVVGRLFKANAAPVGSPWMWTLAFGHHEDRSPTHGYAATREAAMAAFAKSGRRGRSPRIGGPISPEVRRDAAWHGSRRARVSKKKSPTLGVGLWGRKCRERVSLLPTCLNSQAKGGGF
jgi:hypothetical protein